MLKIKALLTKILTLLNGMGVAKVGDYSSELYNATSGSPWESPASGIMVIYAGTNSVAAYWYVSDLTDNLGVARAVRPGTANYQLGASFPVIKGHEYWSQTSGLTTTRVATLYKIGGGTS